VALPVVPVLRGRSVPLGVRRLAHKPKSRRRASARRRGSA
jgi:hypothetical protein